jgi:probable HAF family extracellular repeat protein
MNPIAKAIIWGLIVIAARPAWGGYFVPLGHLPNKHPLSAAADVSADGAVVVGWGGFAHQMGGDVDSFRWTRADGLVGLGRLPNTAGSWATGVSADGSVVIGNGLFWSTAFRWTSEAGIEALPVAGQTAINLAAISADGSVVIGAFQSGFVDGGRPAFRWSAAEGLIELGDLPGGGVFGRPMGLSADGSVVVGSTSVASGSMDLYEAVRWTSAGGTVGLGALGDGHRSQATGVSADGSVVVGWSGSGDGASGQEAFRWTSAGGIVGLGFLHESHNYSSAEDVSADGSVIVGWSSSASGNRAVVWDAGHGMRSVSDILTAQGVDLTGWMLTNATAISADGTTVVGNGINPRGQSEAWLANITAVPEPSATALTGLAWATVNSSRKRRAGFRS